MPASSETGAKSTTSAEQDNGALDGLTVLDFSTLLPGPMASATLLGHGARVIKIERPGGEDMRRFPPLQGDTSAPYIALNQGKHVLEMDLKSPDAFGELMPLIGKADILIEQFRPGVMERLGFGFKTLQVINPRLIYVSITGYGQAGPRAQEAGHDINYQARSGLLGQSLNGSTRNPLPPALIADIAGGAMTTVTQILLALRKRDKTGQGCHIDISMSGSVRAFLWYQQAIFSATAHHSAGGDGLLTGGSPRYGLYKTSDNRFLAVGALEDKFWQVFCSAISLPLEMAGQGADSAQAKQVIARIISAKSSSFWRRTLEPLDCCCSIVATLDEVQSDPHFSDIKASARSKIRRLRQKKPAVME